MSLWVFLSYDTYLCCVNSLPSGTSLFWDFLPFGSLCPGISYLLGFLAFCLLDFLPFGFHAFWKSLSGTHPNYAPLCLLGFLAFWVSCLLETTYPSYAPFCLLGLAIATRHGPRTTIATADAAGDAAIATTGLPATVRAAKKRQLQSRIRLLQPVPADSAAVPQQAAAGTLPAQFGYPSFDYSAYGQVNQTPLGSMASPGYYQVNTAKTAIPSAAYPFPLVLSSREHCLCTMDWMERRDGLEDSVLLFHPRIVDADHGLIAHADQTARLNHPSAFASKVIGNPNSSNSG
ncbi:hypothetical protein METBIDRAFT_141618 [Metschnikowia bicuspidata var. bicuspidata NRRL YB-4993]|uniref:Uncharacterized protein n=1 Tax=Metschnikowia bicuspidata var. bicuspidata NRRL YB-4993 TaxID=869754 RepID=A0A1A0HDC7_9ASCO|nr:hypothetical protein METBIDRAFT_141618 [Metschnikowia bicuspidata var. bicuspidata NRRL YB-4993]OBA21933.1 hypothetical protein METBIDRAFT_141618 [Metschnikowia bicuspidata var. bicuspidata NRRL YB-4993]